jgi:hypothetical protein
MILSRVYIVCLNKYIDIFMKKGSDDVSIDNWNEVVLSQNNVEEVKPKSVCDFDHNDVKKWDDRLTSDMKNDELLKILIVRGRENDNPVLWKGCESVLKQIKGESYSYKSSDSQHPNNMRNTKDHPGASNGNEEKRRFDGPRRRRGKPYRGDHDTREKSNACVAEMVSVSSSK